MINVQVTYPGDKVLDVEVAEELTTEETLENAWTFLQALDTPNQFLIDHQARSSMVGDVYRITWQDKPRVFIVAGTGFKETLEAVITSWEKLPLIERSIKAMTLNDEDLKKLTNED